MLRNVRLLYIHNFLTDFRFSAAFIVVYMAQVTGSYTMAMMLMAVENIVSAVMDVPTGILSDRAGRRKTIMLGSACVALSFVCYATAPGLWILLLGAALHGISMCLFNGNNNALLFETLKSANREKDYHHHLGRTSSMFQLALASSGFCAIFLVHFGLRWVVALSIIPQILGFIVAAMFTEPRVHIPSEHGSFTHFKQAVVKVWRNPRLLGIVAGQAINYGADELKFQFQTAYFNMLWPTWALGLYRGLTHGLSFFGFWFSGKLIDRIGEPFVLIGRDIYWFVSQCIGLALNNVLTPFFFIICSPLFGPGIVARDHLMQKEFTDEQRATMGSIASFAASVVFSAVGLAIGLIASRFSPAAAVWFGTFVCVLSLPIHAWVFRKEL